MSEIEDTAKGMGWIPKDQFRGDQTKWTDAETFVSRGQNFIPFMKKELRSVKGENDQLRGEIRQLTEAQKESQVSLKALTEYNAEIARKEAKIEARRIRAEIVQARKEGDTEREVELEEALEEHREKAEVIGKKTEPATTPASSTSREAPAGPGSTAPDPTKSPEFIAFKERNPWVDSDPVMTAAANVILGQLLRDEDFKKLTPTEKWDRVAEETIKRFEAPERRTSKFESGNGSTRTPASSKGKGYADLPADAKAACDSFTSDVVGPNKAFKTPEAWQDKYAKDHFASEA